MRVILRLDHSVGVPAVVVPPFERSRVSISRNDNQGARAIRLRLDLRIMSVDGIIILENSGQVNLVWTASWPEL